MLRRFSFWLYAAAVMQALSAAFHSISFFLEPAPQNETEKQLIGLITNYHPDAGMGFHPSFMQLFTGLSLCFTLLCLFGASLNWYLKKMHVQPHIFKGVLLLEIIIFGLLFLAMLAFTFPPPIFCTLLIFVFLCGAYFTCRT